MISAALFSSYNGYNISFNLGSLCFSFRNMMNCSTLIVSVLPWVLRKYKEYSHYIYMYMNTCITLNISLKVSYRTKCKMWCFFQSTDFHIILPITQNQKSHWPYDPNSISIYLTPNSSHKFPRLLWEFITHQKDLTKLSLRTPILGKGQL